MRTRRTTMVLGVLAAGAMVLFASAAFACTAFLQLFGPGEAPGLSQVTITGTALQGGKDVELRWNGAKGPVVGTATTTANGNFSAVVAVPDVSPGVYFLVVGGENFITARKSIRVTPAFGSAPVQSAPSPVLATDFGGTTSPAPAGSPATTGLLLLVAGLALTAVGVGVAVSSRRTPALGTVSRTGSHTS